MGQTPAHRALSTDVGRRLLSVLPLLAGGVVVACGGAGAGSPPATTSAAVPRARALIAVLQRATGGSTSDRIVIVGTDGRVRASASFAPRARMIAGAPAPAPEAEVAAGTVYYIDALGAVWRLGASGGPVRVADLAASSARQEVSFAVSPSGGHVVASVLTVPVAAATRHVAVEMATVGGGTVVLRRGGVSARGPGATPEIVGWDSIGPVAVPEAATGDLVAGDLWSGPPDYLDAHGMLGPPLTDPGCGGVQVEPDATILCDRPGPPGRSIVDLLSEGTLLHRFTRVGSSPRLSPDGERLVYRDGGNWIVQALDGRTSPVPSGLNSVEGWLNSDTLIGVIGGRATGDLAYLRPEPYEHPLDLGIAGELLGVLPVR